MYKHIHDNYYISSDDRNLILSKKLYSEKKQEDYYIIDGYYRSIEHLITSLTDKKIYEVLTQDNIVNEIKNFKEDIKKFLQNYQNGGIYNE